MTFLLLAGFEVVFAISCFILVISEWSFVLFLKTEQLKTHLDSFSGFSYFQLILPPLPPENISLIVCINENVCLNT